jgi:hypothetical protein
MAGRDASPATLRHLSRRWWTAHDSAVRRALARNPRTPPDVLAELAWDPAIRPFVAENPATPTAQLDGMYADPGSRAGLAANPSTPVELLHRVATTPDPNIRWALLRNPALPDDILADLERDAEVGHYATSTAHRRREGPRWVVIRPPFTWRWRNPFRRVFDDAAPEETWSGGERFDTREACEWLRAENVRRERNRRGPIRESWERPTDWYAHTRCALRP